MTPNRPWISTGSPATPNPASIANGPFQANAGPESRQKNCSCPPALATTSRFPGVPKLLWIIATPFTCWPRFWPNGMAWLQGRNALSLFRQAWYRPWPASPVTSSKFPLTPNRLWISTGLPVTAGSGWETGITQRPSACDQYASSAWPLTVDQMLLHTSPISSPSLFSVMAVGPVVTSGSLTASASSWLKTLGMELPPVRVPSLVTHA